MITVVLVDDEPMVRQGLRTILESEDGIRVVGEAGDGASPWCERPGPTWVCLDVRMPGFDGIRAAELVAKGRSNAEISARLVLGRRRSGPTWRRCWASSGPATGRRRW